MPKQVKKTISINLHAIEWLDKNYPDWSLQWVVNTLLDNLIEVTGEYTPSNLAVLAARKFKETEEI